MNSKIVEIRDSGTFIPALAVRLGSTDKLERCLLARSGYGLNLEDQTKYIVLCKINGGEPCKAHIDPHAWGRNPHTMFIAHMYLLNRLGELQIFNKQHEGFDSLSQGHLIDVEYILGSRDTPKLSACAR